jgi:hypothetical protein
MTFLWIICNARKSQSKEWPTKIVLGEIIFRSLLCTSAIVVLTPSMISIVIPANDCMEALECYLVL